MANYKTKKQQRERRHMRLRKTVSGSSEKPRLSVCFTSKHIYAQIIDDDSGKTIASSSSLSPALGDKKPKTNMEGAILLGKVAAEMAIAKGIKSVVFDRGGFRYHGRVKAFADSARSTGLKF